jgi:type IV fimbrial biogenesis protein FimT
MMRSRQSAFTLYELLITMAVVATLVAIGIPSFAEVTARQRQRTEINALFHAVHLARKESIVRRRPVTICPSADGRQCRGGRDWSDGWIMFVNTDGDSPTRVDAGEPVLSRHEATAVTIRANRQSFTLRSIFRYATNGTIVVCDPADRVPALALVISWTGRPRVAGETPRGAGYRCAH